MVNPRNSFCVVDSFYLLKTIFFVTTIRTLRNLLRSRAAEGNTVFVSSHLLGEVEQLADDVVVVNRGRLVTRGSRRRRTV